MPGGGVTPNPRGKSGRFDVWNSNVRLQLKAAQASQQLKELLQDRIHALEAKLRNVNARVEQFAVFASG